MKQDNTEKLQKVLARAGVGSRREMERWIEEGKIRVNDRKALIGDRVSSTDRIRVNGRLIKFPTSKLLSPRVIAYYKPEGQICSHTDPHHPDNVFMHLPKIASSRWVMIGRLDINTAGLLLFTNDGELAHRLMHPSFEVVREYSSRIIGTVDQNTINTLTRGVELKDGKAKFESIEDAGGKGANHWYNVTLKEGKKREVRRLWQSQGVEVSRLIRIRYGTAVLPRTLTRGKWIELDIKEINDLRELVSMEAHDPKDTILRHHVAKRRHQVRMHRRRK